MMGGLLIFCFTQKNHKYREQIALLEARSLLAYYVINLLRKG